MIDGWTDEWQLIMWLRRERGIASEGNEGGALGVSEDRSELET